MEGEFMNRLLVVVDMQRDFIDGSLGTRQAQEIVTNVKRKSKNIRLQETM